MTPLKAIRLKCLDCSCNNLAEVRNCPITTCSLYEYRMGHNPARQHKGNSNFSQKTAIESDEIDKERENND